MCTKSACGQTEIRQVYRECPAACSILQRAQFGSRLGFVMPRRPVAGAFLDEDIGAAYRPTCSPESKQAPGQYHVSPCPRSHLRLPRSWVMIDHHPGLWGGPPPEDRPLSPQAKISPYALLNHMFGNVFNYIISLKKNMPALFIWAICIKGKTVLGTSWLVVTVFVSQRKVIQLKVSE